MTMQIHPQTLSKWFRDHGFDMNRIVNPAYIRIERITDDHIGVYLEVKMYETPHRKTNDNELATIDVVIPINTWPTPL